MLRTLACQCLTYFIEPSCIDLAEVYRDNFQPSIFSDEPKISVGVFSICADTDKEAEELFKCCGMETEFSKGYIWCISYIRRAKSSINGDLVGTNDNRTFVGSPQTVGKNFNLYWIESIQKN